MASSNDYTISFTVEKTPEEVFKAINNVRGWWSGRLEGDTDKLNAEFIYRYPDVHYSKQKIVELIPGKKIVWHVEEADMNFIKDRKEWEGTDITFDIAEKDGKTEVTFTHVGLGPEVECFEVCSNSWGMLVSGNLRRLIETGKDQPNAF